ncbi:LSM7-like [Zea mays]|uniref:LSM7-like n=1 Tax=Zea mays TaxID=4577 RepID=A0A1D6DX60_MAIZE|nr:LSM7-like [Zea mays]
MSPSERCVPVGKRTLFSYRLVMNSVIFTVQVQLKTSVIRALFFYCVRLCFPYLELTNQISRVRSCTHARYGPLIRSLFGSQELKRSD